MLALASYLLYRSKPPASGVVLKNSNSISQEQNMGQHLSGEIKLVSSAGLPRTTAIQHQRMIARH